MKTSRRWKKKIMSKKLKLEELNHWLEYIVQRKIDGKPIDEEQSKYLEELKDKTVTLEDATVIARFLARYQTDPLYQFFDVISVLLQDKLGVSEKDFKEATEKVQEAIEQQEEENSKVVKLDKDKK